MPMVQMRALVFLPFTLCFVACLCAATDATIQPNKTTTEKAVKTLKELTEKVLDKAKNKFNEAEKDKTAVDAKQDKAKLAESQVKAAAEENDNADIKDIAEKAKKTLEECNTLYEEAKKNAKSESDTLKEMVLKATKLNTSVSTEILSLEQEDNYTKIIEIAANITSAVQKLNTEINASSSLSTAENALLKLSAKVQIVQIFKYQTDSIVSFSEITTMIKTAESDIQIIQQKNNEVNKTVQEMKKILESASHSSIGMLHSLYGSAESQLHTASRTLTEAKNSYKKMLDHKTQADQGLAAVKIVNEENKAKTELKKIENQAKLVKKELEIIYQALKTANISVSNTKSLHKQMLKGMPQENNKSSIEPNNGNPKDDVNTVNVKTPVQNGDTVKKRLNNTGESMHKESEQSMEVNVDSTEKHESPQLMYTDNNSELINHQILRNITKNKTQIPLIGEKVSKWEAENDSAKILSISLLVAFTVSVVLQ